jgi:hypothetical protein
LRAADPHVVILVGAISYFFDSLLGGSFLQGADRAARPAAGRRYHSSFYLAGPPESVATDVGYIRDLLGAAGQVIPVWSGELGWSTCDPTRRRRVCTTSLRHARAQATSKLEAALARHLRGGVEDLLPKGLPVRALPD